MEARVNNELGFIAIDEHVLGTIAGMTATECYGIVGMAAKGLSDGVVSLLKKDNLSKGVKITIDEEKIFVDMHVIIEYGVKISVIAESVISTVKYTLENLTGLNVEQVKIFVESVRVER
jgi:uncharacterized alkaline shock family protein YloU